MLAQYRANTGQSRGQTKPNRTKQKAGRHWDARPAKESIEGFSLGLARSGANRKSHIPRNELFGR